MTNYRPPVRSTLLSKRRQILLRGRRCLSIWTLSRCCPSLRTRPHRTDGARNGALAGDSTEAIRRIDPTCLRSAEHPKPAMNRCQHRHTGPGSRRTAFPGMCSRRPATRLPTRLPGKHPMKRFIPLPGVLSRFAVLLAIAPPFPSVRTCPRRNPLRPGPGHRWRYPRCRGRPDQIRRHRRSGDPAEMLPERTSLGLRHSRDPSHEEAGRPPVGPLRGKPPRPLRPSDRRMFRGRPGPAAAARPAGPRPCLSDDIPPATSGTKTPPAPKGLGLWSGSFVEPWRWRRQHRRR